jgi:hypothetical protein
MRRCLSLLAIAGCAAARTAPKSTHEAADGKTPRTLAADQIPQPRFDVVPAELGDANVLSRLRARVVVRRWDVAFFAENGDQIGRPNTSTDSSYDVYDIVPVIDAGRKIRIVTEDDGARIAVWIARETAQTTVLVPSTIGTDAIGVQFRPGAPIDLGEKSTRGRNVSFMDREILVRGTLPSERVGYVFVASADDPPPSLGPPESRSWEPPKDSRPRVLLAPKSSILAAPSPTADVLATLFREEVLATRVAEHGAFLEIELHRPFVRVRGFVETERTREAGDRIPTGQGGGHGFGVSHSVTHVLPAQTCLYDRVNGDVIGTTLAARSRIGGSVAEHWAMVYVDTVWGAQKLFIKDLGDDPTTPQWDTCGEEAHRR